MPKFSQLGNDLLGSGHCLIGDLTPFPGTSAQLLIPLQEKQEADFVSKWVMQSWAAYMGLNTERILPASQTLQERKMYQTWVLQQPSKSEAPAPSAGDSGLWWLELSRSDHSLLFLRQGFTV